jgi:tripartite-type tricarboxylate transporter receptor subunit TctC
MFKKIAMILSFMLLASTGVHAEQKWPTKPVKVMVGFAPGGGTDIAARIWAKNMSEIWGQPVIVENRPGAGGNLGIRHMLNEPADGYTLSSIQTGNFGPQHILTKPGYNWKTDFAHVAYSGDAPPFVVVVNTQSKVTNLKEFRDWSRAKTLSYAFPGIGVPHHIFGALLSEHFNVTMTPVPYKSVPMIVNDLVSGQLDFVVMPVSSLLEQNVKIGKLSVIAVFGERRWQQFPDAQTAGQQGISGSWPRQWYEIIAPAATPAHIVRKIQEDSKTAWNRTFVELVEKGVIDSSYKDYPASFEQSHQMQQEAWNSVIQRSKIKSIE